MNGPSGSRKPTSASMTYTFIGDMPETNNNIELFDGDSAKESCRTQRRHIRPENIARKLFFPITEQGAALKEKTVSISAAILSCIDLPEEELMQPKGLLSKTLIRMEART